MAARFWVGGTGTWDAVTTTNWSATSGGAGGASVPTSSDDVNFDVNSGTSATVSIATTGANANTITINKSDLTLTHVLVGSTVVGAVTLTTGTLNTANQTCSWGSFNSSNANVRTLTLEASAITITGAGSGWSMATTTNLTVTANTATVTSSTLNTFAGGNANYNGLSVSLSTAALAITGAFTVGNLTLTIGAVKTSAATLAGSITVSTLLTLTGNSTVNRLFLASSVVGTARTITAATVSLTNVDFTDIAGAGAASPFTGTSLGDSLGNSNITFDAPATQTRTGAGGNWSTSGNWTSRVPLPQDDVVIAAGASGTISGDMPRGGKSVDWTGFTGAWSNAISVTYYGNITLATGMTVTNSTSVVSGRGSQTITSSGKTLTHGFSIVAPGGTYTLQDAMVSNSVISVLNGGFNANNFNVTCLQFSSTTTDTITMGSGTWSLTATTAISIWNLATSTLIAGTSTIVVTNASTNSRTFAGGGKTYNVLTYTVAGSTGALVITGANSFATINFSDASNVRTLTLPSSTTTTITSAFNVNGLAGKLMTLNSSSGGVAATLSKSSGTVLVDYLSIQDSTATGGATFNATHSTNVSGNTGWSFLSSGSEGSSMLMLGVG